MLRNTEATFNAQFMWKLSNTEKVEKKCSLKKRCILLVSLMIPPSSRCKAYLIYSFFSCEFEVVFAWIVKKLVFLVQILWILKLPFDDWPLWKDFYKKNSSFVQRTTCVILSKQHLFCSNNAPDIKTTSKVISSQKIAR